MIHMRISGCARHPSSQKGSCFIMLAIGPLDQDCLVVGPYPPGQGPGDRAYGAGRPKLERTIDSEPITAGLYDEFPTQPDIYI